MKRFALLVAMCALSQTAMAQAPACQSIADPAARLACYDKSAGPPASTASAKPAMRAAPASAATTKYVDTIADEEALMQAKLKNICRGC